MWNRVELKERAKGVLRKYYWIAFVVTLVAGLLGGLQSGVSFRFGGHEGWFWNGHDNWLWNGQGNWFWGWLDRAPWHAWNGWDIRFDGFQLPGLFGGLFAAALAVAGVTSLAFGVGAAIRIFLCGPVEVGMDRYFLEARQDRSDIANLFHSFRGGRYLGVVKAQAWRLLFTFLWSLLFVIPGIVKSYAYGMIPYLMADNPGMDYKRAMTLSMAMTKGKKGEIFVLDLSFILWFLACVCTCGVGFLFLNPYYYGTRAELYAELKQQALASGLCTPAEVGLEPVLAA